MKTLRAIGMLLVVVGLVLATGGAVFAQEPELAKVKGVIEAINIKADTVTIAPEQGEAVILTITGDTEINKDEQPATIEDLAEDDEVEALYNPETLEAVEITAKSPESAEKPGQAGGPPDKRGPHSPKHGLFGTVLRVTKNDATYVIRLDTEEGIVDVTADDTTKYMVPRLTKGPVDLTGFEDALGDPPAIEGRRLALLVTPLTTADTPSPDYTANAIRLMLIPSSDSPRSHAHRVGVVTAFTEGVSITIVDKNGDSHDFVLNGAVYRPEETSAGAIAGGFVTVVTKGDPKLGPVAKAIVLHKGLPDWGTP